MKAIFGLKKHSYLKTIGTFMIAVALIAGVVGCEGEPVPEYNLATAVNPAGTGTATDQTGTSPYEEGEVVDIEAIPADCFRFVDWTASAGTFGDPNAANTTFTMPAQDVTVTANFELTPPDHFKFYEVDYETAPEVGVDVHLVDQFGAFDVVVGDAISFGNPVEKVHNDVVTPIEDPDRHYTLYEIDYGEEPILSTWKVVVNNQFQDDVELTVQGPIALAVPTTKEGHEDPVCLNHFLVYLVMEEEFPEVGVNLKDQFIEEDVTVWEPVLFANPVQKTVDDVVTEIEKDDEHLVFYSIEDIGFDESINKTIQIDNQFGEQILLLTYRDTLAVPSQKISWEQPLDHFKAYFASWAGGEPPATFPVEVQLKDQFITEWLGEPISANVTGPVLFANPADKWHLDEWTPISDPNDHLTFYWIDYDEEFAKTWDVTVKNQFGEDQWLRVEGPLFLAVPTKKGPHDPPVGLDHFLVYEVLDYDNEPVEVIVDLWDQFTLYNDNVGVYEPELFANPVQKIHGSEVVDIKNPDDHLLFYWINGGDFYLPELPIANQFGPQFLTVEEEMNPLLGVPSVKIEWAPWEPIL